MLSMLQRLVGRLDGDIKRDGLVRGIGNAVAGGIRVAGGQCNAVITIVQEMLTQMLMEKHGFEQEWTYYYC